MKDQREIGVVFIYINMFIRTIAALVVPPIVIRCLGMETYGLLSLPGGVLILLPLLDFGMTSTVLRYASEYKAKDDIEGLNNFLGLCQRFFYGVALVSGIFCFCFYFALPDIFGEKLTGHELDQLKIMYILVAFTTVINYTRCLYTNVLGAFQRYFFSGILAASSLIFTGAGTILFALNGQGAIAITAVGAAFQILNLFPAKWYCKKYLNIKPNLRYWDWGLLKTSLHYSIWVFVGSISGMLGDNLGPFVIGSTCGTEASGILRSSMQILSYLGMGAAVSVVFFPKIVKMVNDDVGREELTKLWIKIGRIDMLIALLLVGGFFILGKPFVFLWLKEKADIDVWYSGMVSSFILPFIAPLGIAWFVLQARNLLKFKACAILGCNLAASVCGYWLASSPNYGLFGWLGSRLLFGGIIFVILSIIYFYRVLELDVTRFIREVYLGTWIPLIASAVIIPVSLIYYPISNWGEFLVYGCSYAAIFAGMTWLFVLRREEKEIVTGMLAKVNFLKRSSKQ